MNCPRCGAQNAPQALACGRCGLPFRQAAQPDRARPSRPRSDAPWGDMPPGAGNQGSSSGQWPIMPDSQQASGQWPAAPDSRQPQGQWPMNSDPRQGMGPWTAPPSPANMPPAGPMGGAMMGTPSRMVGYPSGSLFAGASVQGGRYRVLTPFAPSRVQTNPQQTGFPQWTAFDAGRRGDRVVLMEVPLGAMPLREADRARESIANRLMVVGQNPNVQGALNAFFDQGRHFIVLRFVEGTFLSDRVRGGGPLPEPLMLAYANQLLGVLDFFSGLSPQAIHGMISPDTLVVGPDGDAITLVGWSPAIVARWLGLVTPLALPQPTPFSAPELQRGQLDTRSDTFGLGATLFYAVTASDASQRSAGIFPPVRQINPTVSPPTEAVLAKSLRLIPSQRYQDPQEMQLDISRAMRGESPNRDPLSALEPIFPRRNGAAIAITGVISFLLVAVLVAVLYMRGRPTVVVSTTQLPTPTINPIALTLAAKDEGLSTGLFIFDTAALASAGSFTSPCPATPVVLPSTPPSTPVVASTAPPQASDQTSAGAVIAELQGSCDLRAGNVTQAAADFDQAVQDDPSNPEARIYDNDAKVLASGTHNFITLDIAVSFGSADLETSRQVLRGVALAQTNLNESGGLPGGGMVRIEIASIGPDVSAAPFVSQYFSDLIAQNNPSHTVGVISFSPTNLTQNETKLLVKALVSLESNHEPTIVPVGTADVIQQNQYFFQLTPLVKDQSLAIMQTALSPPFNGRRIAVVVDESNLGSDYEYGQVIEAALPKAPLPVTMFPENMPDMSQASIAKVARDVQVNGIDTVIFAGSSDGVRSLAAALAQQGTPVPIIAAPPADSPALVGQGGSPTAQFALSNPRIMQMIHVVGLADPGEWSFLHQSNATITIPQFFSDFTSTFSTTTTSAFATAPAIFSFDAVNVAVYALTSAHQWTATQIPTPEGLSQGLSVVNGTNAFQGISGRISFGNPDSGFPDHRPLVIKSITLSNQENALGQKLLQWNINAIISVDPSFSGQQAFCASADCALTQVGLAGSS